MKRRPVRTRFAPSPTGFLHIGGARTALFSWLYARHHGGSFVLRIEDTDEGRSSRERSLEIVAALEWLGLDHDEEIVFQSGRKERYAEAAEQLLDEGKAYRCYCTRQELADLRAGQLAKKLKPRYDGRCRKRTAPRAGVDPVIRFANPGEGGVVFDDCVHGRIEVRNEELDDLVIVRADGMPTYNFSVVVDDADMGITHVIRGDDHINNTPRQINIHQALNAPLPVYAHLPMILDEHGKRMSKRTGAVSIGHYRRQGYLPQALCNYLVRLGWSHGDREVLSVAEMIELFDLDAVNLAAAGLNPDKLDWLNAHYLKEMPVEELARQFAQQVAGLGWQLAEGPEPTQVLPLLRERYKTIRAMAQGAKFLYCSRPEWDAEIAAQKLSADAHTSLEALLPALEQVGTWREDALKQAIDTVLTTMKIKMSELGRPLRLILTAGAPSPGLALTLQWIGRERTLTRIHTALTHRRQ